MCFYWPAIALPYSHWFRYAVYNNLACLRSCYSTPPVPIGQDELYCILIVLSMRFTQTLACPCSVLHYHYSTSRVLIGQDELYCILIGYGMRFTTNLSCMMDLHYYYKAPFGSICQG
jgi:hypothetical protein